MSKHEQSVGETRGQIDQDTARYPALRDEYDPELVDEAIEKLDGYHEAGDKVYADLDPETSILVLSDAELSGFVDPEALYEELVTEVGDIDSFDSQSDADELAAAARCAVTFKAKAYSQDIARQIATEDVGDDELAVFVKRFINQFPIWYSLNYSVIHREIGAVHDLLAQLRGKQHLSSQLIRDILAEHGY
jgi:hypothetical protein